MVIPDPPRPSRSVAEVLTSEILPAEFIAILPDQFFCSQKYRGVLSTE